MSLTTQRLLLRKWEKEDAQALYSLASNPKIGQGAGWQPHKNIEESQQIIEHVLKPSQHCYAITLQEIQEIIGCIELRLACKEAYEFLNNYDANQVFEIGYWLGEPYWGKGYMKEACQSLISYAFNYCQAQAVIALHNISNMRSQYVMQSLGMEYLGTIRHKNVALLGKDVYWDEHIRIIREEDFL
ncbi:MAG: GNAT family N-acetyltransferase [Bifidobacteriaceae bacterium]|nr:GNAT family N-acetyltransferase [Bifidobacteriaceae bacterium]